MKQNRKPGYYWIKTGYRWQIALWETNRWHVIGIAALVYDDDLSQIHEHPIKTLEEIEPPPPFETKRSVDGIMDDREQEMVKLICAGLTAGEIADKMCKSPRTIESIRHKLMHRLNIANVVQLVLFAVHIGLVQAAPPNEPEDGKS